MRNCASPLVYVDGLPMYDVPIDEVMPVEDIEAVPPSFLPHQCYSASPDPSRPRTYTPP